MADFSQSSTPITFCESWTVCSLGRSVDALELMNGVTDGCFDTFFLGTSQQGFPRRTGGVRPGGRLGGELEKRDVEIQQRQGDSLKAVVYQCLRPLACLTNHHCSGYFAGHARIDRQGVAPLFRPC